MIDNTYLKISKDVINKHRLKDDKESCYRFDLSFPTFLSQDATQGQFLNRVLLV